MHGIGRGQGPYEVRWRNVKLRNLDSFVSLYNGNDLTGWVTSGNWIVEKDGVLLIQPRDGEKGWQRYGDYLWSEKKTEQSYGGTYFSTGTVIQNLESPLEIVRKNQHIF